MVVWKFETSSVKWKWRKKNHTPNAYNYFPLFVLAPGFDDRILKQCCQHLRTRLTILNKNTSYKLTVCIRKEWWRVTFIVFSILLKHIYTIAANIRYSASPSENFNLNYTSLFHRIRQFVGYFMKIERRGSFTEKIKRRWGRWIG